MRITPVSSLTFLIPAYNDEETIRQVIADADRAGKAVAKKHSILVIDDASRDNTPDILENLKKKYRVLSVIHHVENGGYGRTIRDLYYTAADEWLFTVPGDGQIPPMEVVKLLPYITEADMILGWRVNRNDPPQRLRQSRIYNSLLRMLYGLKLHDVNTVRLMRTAVFKKMYLSSQSAFVDAELAIRMQRNKYRILEIPIGHKSRDGSTGGGGHLTTILPTIREMLLFRFFGGW